MSNVRDVVYPRGRLDPTVIGNQLNQWAPRLGFAWDLLGRNKTVIRGNAGVFYAQNPLSWLAGPLTDVSSRLAIYLFRSVLRPEARFISSFSPEGST